MGFVEDLLEGRDFHFSIPYGPGLWRALRRWPAEEVAQWHGILSMYSYRCADLPWTVYIETALPALGELVLALIDFDWDDIARGYLRPSGIRSRALVADVVEERFLTKFHIPEIGDEIGARLPGAKLVKSFTNHKGVRWLFKIDAFLQKLLLYWMVIDLTDDFFYNWALGIMKTDYCAMSSKRATYVEQYSPAVYGVTPGWEGAVPPYWPSSKIWHSGGGISSGGYDWWGSLDAPTFVVWTCKPTAHIFGSGWIQFRFSLQQGLASWDGPITVFPGQSVVLSALLPAGTKVQPWVRVEGEFPVAHVRYHDYIIQGWEV